MCMQSNYKYIYVNVSFACVYINLHPCFNVKSNTLVNTLTVQFSPEVKSNM